MSNGLRFFYLKLDRDRTFSTLESDNEDRDEITSVKRREIGIIDKWIIKAEDTETDRTYKNISQSIQFVEKSAGTLNFFKLFLTNELVNSAQNK